MKLIGLIVLLSLAMSGQAIAENGCPSGYQPWRIPMEGPNDCAPIPGYIDDSQAQSVVWPTRWGAIATDVTNGKLGAVVGVRTKKQAQKAAASQCRANGGKKCQIDIVYYNQCAVMILGSKKYNTASAASIGEATRIGMKTCNASDTNCRVYYSDCSLPERVQ